MYKSADHKAKVKKQAVGGQDQLCAAQGALRQAPEPYQVNGPTRSATDLDKYFYALATAYTTENTVLEELVRYNAALTTSSAEFSASVDSLIKANEKLSCRVGNLQINQNTQTQEDTPPHPKTLCPHFKIEVMHAPNSCFGMDKNAARHPRGWKSRL